MKELSLVFGTLLIVGLAVVSWRMPNLPPEKTEMALSPTFKKYWNDGNAEISSYTLQQSRYGELHEGEATMIFVTEPFSKSKQVKLDDYRNEKDRVDVLKLNATRKFDTGIYPYSTMTSIFTPYESTGRALKVTTSVQEWCGHAFMQLNRRGNKIKFSGRSYFEQEGDQELSIANAYLEDEIWNLIRINPEWLPKGRIDLIPSSLFLRLKHHEPKSTAAVAQLEQVDNPTFGNETLYQYTIEYTQPESRKLSIYFDKSFPYQIRGWEEKGRLTTTATLKKSIRLDYWTKNSKADKKLQELLD